MMDHRRLLKRAKRTTSRAGAVPESGPVENDNSVLGCNSLDHAAAKEVFAVNTVALEEYDRRAAASFVDMKSNSVDEQPPTASWG
jgi:hypothetical protein